jgi:hypothetical protein
MNGKAQPRRPNWRFNIHACKGEPGAALAAVEELNPPAQPLALDAGGSRYSDLNHLRRARLNRRWRKDDLRLLGKAAPARDERQNRQPSDLSPKES